MLRLETPHVDIMSLEPAEILDPVSKVFALLKMSGSVLVPLGPVPFQGKVDQGPAKNGGRKRVLGLQRSRGRGQDLVEVTLGWLSAWAMARSSASRSSKSGRRLR
jgi:hypothetical protein